MRISTVVALSSLAASGLPASSSARSGLPRPRSQSASMGRNSSDPDSRRAALSSERACAHRPVEYAVRPAASRTAATRDAIRVASLACRCASSGSSSKKRPAATSRLATSSASPLGRVRS